jgi:hypothetical protein
VVQLTRRGSGSRREVRSLRLQVMPGEDGPDIDQFSPASETGLSPDPRVMMLLGVPWTCRCPSCVEDWSCDGLIDNATEGHLSGASIS